MNDSKKDSPDKDLPESAEVKGSVENDSEPKSYAVPPEELEAEILAKEIDKIAAKTEQKPEEYPAETEIIPKTTDPEDISKIKTPAEPENAPESEAIPKATDSEDISKIKTPAEPENAPESEVIPKTTDPEDISKIKTPAEPENAPETEAIPKATDPEDISNIKITPAPESKPKTETPAAENPPPSAADFFPSASAPEETEPSPPEEITPPQQEAEPEPAQEEEIPAAEITPPQQGVEPPSTDIEQGFEEIPDVGEASAGETNTAEINTEISKSDESTPAAPENTEIAEEEVDGGHRITQIMRIGERLVNEGLISSDQLQIAMKVQKDSPEAERAMLGQILVDLGFITESALGEVLAESTGVEQFDPSSAVLDSNLIKQVPKNVATRHKVVPVLQEENTIYLAMADIYNVLAIDQIQRHFPKNYKIAPVYCPEAEILELIDNYYDYEMSIDGILREIETGMADESNEINGELEGYTNPTVRLVDALLVDAIKIGVSDLHFEPEGAFLRLRYRIDGKLHQIRSFHKDYWSAIAVRIKIISGMNIAESRHPQDGRISYNVLGRDVDFRVSSHPTVYGENMVLRILDKKKSLVPLEALGFSEKNSALLKKMLKRPEGIIIATGPTGSGKTTTLYSVLNYINSVDVNIMTLEDPVEYQLSMIRQSNVNKGAGMDFASGLRSIMRQDPDIIFVGEIRDQDTATMALRAAMTGHQVYSTLHTNDALGAIPRLVDIGLKPSLLSGAIICVLAQRLARKLCTNCKEKRPATQEECSILGAEKDNPPLLYEAKGCDRCSHSGYKGRVGINEVLAVDKGLDALIADGASRKVMMDYLSDNGFATMQDDGIQKVRDGLIDMNELIRTIDMTERL